MKFRYDKETEEIVVSEATRIEYHQMQLWLTRKVKGWKFHPAVKVGVWDGNMTFFKNGRKIIAKMKVGEKIQMQWLSMWKKFNYKRVDNKSVWSNSFKDFIVCDHQSYSFNGNVLHEARTQGSNTQNNSIKLKPSKGSVMHFQFVNWKNYQLKQAWYMCHEVIQMKEDIKKTNRKYFYTYFENFPKISRIKNELIE